MYKKYKNFKYKNKFGNVWELVYPHGFRANVEAETEAELLQKIDSLREKFNDVREN